MPVHGGAGVHEQHAVFFPQEGSVGVPEERCLRFCPDGGGLQFVKTALDGISGVMMTFYRVANQPYNMRIDYVDVNKVANKVKYFPTEWISANGHDVTQKAIDYCLPLIQGEQNIRIKNGIPQHFILPCALPRETAKNKS